MRRLLLTLLLVLTLAANVSSEVVFTENFDHYTSEYSTYLMDARPCPYDQDNVRFYECAGCCTSCNGSALQFTTDAARTAGTNKRGMRTNLMTVSQWSACNDGGYGPEIRILKNFSSPLTVFYMRWYQRDSYVNYTNFQKLFRLCLNANGSSQIIIPEWQVNGTAVNMNIFDLASGQNKFITGYNLKTDYTPNTWVSYELKFDLTNKTAELWVDGVSKGSISNSGWTTGWSVSSIYIGGNHYPVGSTGQYIDYDDFVFSTTYIGPEGGTSYSVGGTLSGISAGTLTLRNTANGSTTDDKAITSNGSYTFDARLNADDTYSVTVLSNPMSQKCTVSNGSGTISSNVTNANVTCTASKPSRIGGKVSGGISR